MVAITKYTKGWGGALAGALILAAVPAQAGWTSWQGFTSLEASVKLRDDQTKRDDVNLLESRTQLKASYFFDGDSYWARSGAAFGIKGDFLVDGYYGGKTSGELRELNLSWTPFDWMDVKLGRQVLTWGTGDYLFVNDLFPKDYVSFFIGREDAYLKKPSDAIKMSFYPSWGNVDWVMAPLVTPNTSPTGNRLSFFDLFQGGIAARDSERRLVEPARQLSNSEYALRFYRTWGRTEVATYFFRGFDKNASSVKNEVARELFYPRLDVYGGSVRGPGLGGILNAEVGYNVARQDRQGKDRLVSNSQMKYLVGYSKDLGRDIQLGFQYLFEQQLNYGAYAAALLAGDVSKDERRHLFTTRLTQLWWQQTLKASLFVFYSPSDADGYVRPSLQYDVSDQWRVTLGANVPWGKEDATEFGHMQKNKNVLLRVKYSF